ncbi:MAG: DUF3854 domain-containing protein, partial [Acidobacteria bacterium]|nr:DUF3854 domain-containing protein [Acidobacteriota bacterium]
MSDGSHPKYLSRIGDKVRAYFPHTTTLNMLSDPKVNVVITEGEYKTLAIAEALQKAEQKRKFAVIGLQGVNGGWHREKQVVPTADGADRPNKPRFFRQAFSIMPRQDFRSDVWKL